MATYEQNEANNDEYAAQRADFAELTKLAEEQGFEVEDSVVPNVYGEYEDSVVELIGEDSDHQFSTDREAIEWLKERKGAK